MYSGKAAYKGASRTLYTSLCSAAGCLDHARRIVGKLKLRGLSIIVIFTVVISASLCRHP
jgi:hypothetical protein